MTYLILVSFVWAFSFPLIKGYLTGLDPNFVSFARMFLSLLVFLPFLKLRGVEKPMGLKLAFTGAVQFGLMYIAYITSFQFLPAHTIVLLTTTTPLFITLFNDVHSRKFNALFFVAASMAFMGGAVIKYPDQPLRASLMGILLVQISNIAFAFGQLYYKQLSAKHAVMERSLRLRLPLSRGGHHHGSLLHVHDPLLPDSSHRSAGSRSCLPRHHRLGSLFLPLEQGGAIC